MIRKSKNNCTDSLVIYKQALQELHSGNVKTAYVLSGPENFLVQTFRQELRKFLKLPEDWREQADVHVFDYDNNLSNLDWPSFLSECRMPPFFLERRIMLVKKSDLFARALTNEQQKHFAEFIELLQSDCPLLCLFIEDKIDVRLKQTKAWQKLSGVGLYNFELIDEATLTAWVQKSLAQRHLSITRDALNSLPSRCENSLARLQSEINKLQLYCTANKVTVIDLQTVDSLLQADLQANVFDFLDALGNKNLSAALSKLNALRLNREPVPVILLLIARHMRELFLVKNNATGGINAWKLRKLQEQAGMFSNQDLQQLIMFCADCDFAYKNGILAEDAVLDFLLAKIFQTDLPIKFAEN